MCKLSYNNVFVLYCFINVSKSRQQRDDPHLPSLAHLRPSALRLPLRHHHGLRQRRRRLPRRRVRLRRARLPLVPRPRVLLQRRRRHGRRRGGGGGGSVLSASSSIDNHHSAMMAATSSSEAAGSPALSLSPSVAGSDSVLKTEELPAPDTHAGTKEAFLK